MEEEYIHFLIYPFLFVGQFDLISFVYVYMSVQLGVL